MRFFLSNGKRLKSELENFPMSDEFLPSRLLVFCRKDTEILAVCGIRSVLNILSIYVTEGYRGKRLGTRVLSETIKIARKQKLGFITLPVLVDNLPALRLYLAFRFREIVRLENYKVLMLPLTLRGEIAYWLFRTICSKVPNAVLTHATRSVFQRTIGDW